jgi:colanic acid/amylovoran biosynthesis glycosyltransferase
MIKVLFCTNAFEKVSNGPAKFAHLLLEYASEADMDVRILTEDISSPKHKVYKLRFGIPRIIKPLSQFWRMWKYHRKAMAIREEFPFDVLVYNNALVGILSFIRFPGTVGMINDYGNASSRLGNVLRRKEKINKRHFFYFVEYLAAKSSSRIIVNSDYLKHFLHTAYRTPETKFFKLYKGIENGTSNGTPIEVGKRIPKSLLFVKTDFANGGLFDLIDAIKMMDFQISMTIVGPAASFHEQIIELLEGHCKSLSITGYREQSEIFKMMREHEVFCVPSHKEAFGVGNLEAMAAGCKIVSTNVGGIPEAVGTTGVSWLVPPHSPKDLKVALERAFNTDIAAHQATVQNHLIQFTAEKVVRNFKAIIEV